VELYGPHRRVLRHHLLHHGHDVSTIYSIYIRLFRSTDQVVVVTEVVDEGQVGWGVVGLGICLGTVAGG
jgi:hypothetical protein